MDEPPLIESLPPEILAHVFHFLHHPAPSDHRLHDQPHADLLRHHHHHPTADDNDIILKAVSRVNRRWRGTVLPLLFRNVVWYLDRTDLARAEQAPTDPAAVPVLPFLREHNLTSYVRSFTLVVVASSRSSSRGSGDGGQSTTTTTTTSTTTTTTTSASYSSSSSSSGGNDVGLYRRGDGSGHYGYLPTPLSPPSPFSASRAGAYGYGARERDLVFNEDTNWLWKLIFDVVDPLRFTIVASPRVLASLLARMLFLGDAWSFDQSHHVLSLSRGGGDDQNDDDRQGRVPTTPGHINDSDTSTTATTTTTESTPEQQQQQASSPSSTSSSSPLARPAKRTPSALFTAPSRPWTALLLNEGSSTRVYKTYEYFHKRPPSVLGALLGCEAFPNDAPLLPRSVRALSYVAIFPLSSHLATTLVPHLPPLRRLFVQLVPRNDILRDRKEMEHLDMDDLWAERNRAYESILPRLFGGGDGMMIGGGGGGGGAANANAVQDGGNWGELQEFETGDVLDLEGWEAAVDHVRMGFAEWRMEGRGRFVRRKAHEVEVW